MDASNQQQAAVELTYPQSLTRTC